MTKTVCNRCGEECPRMCEITYHFRGLQSLEKEHLCLKCINDFHTWCRDFKKTQEESKDEDHGE